MSPFFLFLFILLQTGHSALVKGKHHLLLLNWAQTQIDKSNTSTMKTPGYGSNCEASCVGSCGREWKANGNHCYYFSRGKQSWFDAEKFCQRNRGHLASVTDVQSHNFLKGKNTETWIGGVREPGNTTWVWTDCSPWNFTRWAGAEPKNELDNEGCLLHTPDNQWSEHLCTDERRFLCSTTVCSGKTTF